MSGIPDPLGPGTAIRFIGPVAEVAVTAGQRFTGLITVPVSSSGVTTLVLNLCHQLHGTTELQPFGDSVSDMSIQVTAATMLAVASTIAPGVSGTYNVGLCTTGSAGATATFDVLSGWIQVTN